MSEEKMHLVFLCFSFSLGKTKKKNHSNKKNAPEISSPKSKNDEMLSFINNN